MFDLFLAIGDAVEQREKLMHPEGPEIVVEDPQSHNSRTYYRWIELCIHRIVPLVNHVRRKVIAMK